VLPGHHRIRRTEDFRVVIRTGARAATQTLVVHARPSGAEGPARAGFVVGRSVGGAVTRNRVARQLRHQVAIRLVLLPVGTDVVVRALPKAAGSSGADLQQDLDAALRRVMSKLGRGPWSGPGVSQ